MHELHNSNPNSKLFLAVNIITRFKFYDVLLTESLHGEIKKTTSNFVLSAQDAKSNMPRPTKNCIIAMAALPVTVNTNALQISHDAAGDAVINFSEMYCALISIFDDLDISASSNFLHNTNSIDFPDSICCVCQVELNIVYFYS